MRAFPILSGEGEVEENESNGIKDGYIMVNLLSLVCGRFSFIVECNLGV